VTNLATLLLGPLAAPECSRASRGSWLIWVRILPASATGIVAMAILWWWWMSQRIDKYHQPFDELRTALAIIEGMLIVFALLLSPAILAGSLAGEKERGSIGLLLTTRVNSLDIVLGRLAGRLSQVAMIELAALPALLLITAMAGFGWLATLALLALPMSVAFGGGGIALAASAMSRRGRDALLLIYLLDILFLLSPLLGTFGWFWVGLLSPFEPLQPLTWNENYWPAFMTSGIWIGLGLVGLALASWRLRPSCLAEGDDTKARKSGGRRRGLRRGWVPRLDDRPMLWKELYIERVGTLGRAGRWIGGFLVLCLILGSLRLAGYAAWGSLVDYDSSWADWAMLESAFWFGNSANFVGSRGSAMVIGFLIQWAIGLRAAVTISSERERGTWDALLMSPLEGTEIVRGKLWGSLYALKWLIVSAVLAWTITLALGGMFAGEYAEAMIELVVIGTFMAAVGVRTSLRSPTATRSMGMTMALWVGTYLGMLALGLVVCLIVTMLCVIGWLLAVQAGVVTFNSRPWFPMTFRLGMDLVFFSSFLGLAIAIIAETRLRFDRVAGRMTGGKTAVAIDQLIHGKPMAPVFLDGKEKAKVDQAALDEVAR
jgi:ABC-type transport system involved in multi-copper enzyme maturation permease subunit